MELGHSILYGVVQGLTEFLPVSSSAHLALLPKFLEIKDPGVFFDLSMHLGTAFAVMIYYRQGINHIWEELTQGSGPLWHRSPIVANLIVSSAATFVIALILKAQAKSFGRSYLSIAIMLLIFSLVMLYAHLKGRRSELSDQEQETGLLERQIRIKQALIMGVGQALAIFPGGSRSGITVSLARILGMGKEESGRYSFLLALPVIFGGIVFIFIEEAPKLQWQELLLGLVLSFFSGHLAIALFMKILKHFGFIPFIVYRVGLSLFLFYLAFR